MGPSRAVRLAAALELGRRAAVDWPPQCWTIGGSRDIAERLLAEIGHLEHEELRVVLLGTRAASSACPPSLATTSRLALVRIAELFRDAVRCHTARLIPVHSHPSGDPTPSLDDLHTTAEAVASGRLLDVAVLGGATSSSDTVGGSACVIVGSPSSSASGSRVFGVASPGTLWTALACTSTLEASLRFEEDRRSGSPWPAPA